LRSAHESVDEATLAAYLRVSIPTLRRYVSGELNMNWVICTRLAVMPNVQASTAKLPSTTTPRQRASQERRRERRATKRQEEPVLAAV
jgi:hypothetical protein